MKVTQINFINKNGMSRSERTAHARELIRNSEKSDLYMLPELWNTGFFSFSDYERNAEALEGDTVSSMRILAREIGSNIFMGSFAEKRDGKLFNTAVLIGRKGEIISTYSKIHLFGDEKNYMSPSDKISVSDTDFGRVGIGICYDMRFPELFRKMVDDGAEIFLICAAWPHSRLEHWDVFNRVRGLENQAILLSCCSAGFDCGNEYANLSYAVLADGTVASRSSREVTNLEIDTASVSEYRKAFSALRDRKITSGDFITGI